MSVKRKTKREKNTHHNKTLFSTHWNPREIRIYDANSGRAEKEWTKSIFEPDLKRSPDHPCKGWRVARTKPNNSTYKWTIITPRKESLRHKGSNRVMRFSTPANAILACEKHLRTYGTVPTWFT